MTLADRTERREREAQKYEQHTHDGRDHGSRCGVLDQARERGLRSLGNAGVVDAAGML